MPRALERALADLPGMSAAAARRAARGRFVWNADHSAAVMTISSDLYHLDRQGADDVRARRLTRDPAEEKMPAFSPDGRTVAFVRDYDLFVADVDTGREWALTEGGDGVELLNGELDWVYQEEIYGRGNFKGFWWSPDSARLAYLQTDESPVQAFTVVDHLPYRLGLEQTNYPKAGDRNPLVRLGVVPAAGGETTWVDLGRYTPTDMLVVSVGWAPGGDEVVFQVQNREQTWLDLNLADPAGGGMTHLFRETTPAWVSVNGRPPVARRRHVPLAQRALGVEAPLPLPGRRRARSAKSPTASGSCAPCTASTRRPAGSTSRAPAAAPSAAMSTASASTATT